MDKAKAQAVGAWTNQLFAFATTFAFFALAANLQNTAALEAQEKAAANAAALAAGSQPEKDVYPDPLLTTILSEASKPKGPGLNVPNPAVEEPLVLATEIAQAPPPAPATASAPASVEVDGHSAAS